MVTKRLVIAVITGAVLGLVCVIGAQLRSGFEKEFIYLFAFWFNRLIMGMTIGLAPTVAFIPKGLLRGAVIGLLVSFAFFISTGMNDVIGLVAGLFYGIIIEYIAARFSSSHK